VPIHRCLLDGDSRLQNSGAGSDSAFFVEQERSTRSHEQELLGSCVSAFCRFRRRDWLEEEAIHQITLISISGYLVDRFSCQLTKR
jgi:hypothetical protein